MSHPLIGKAMSQLEEIMAGPPGVSDRTLAKREKEQKRIREAGLKEDRMLYAMADRSAYCMDQLDDLGDEEE